MSWDRGLVGHDSIPAQPISIKKRVTWKRSPFLLRAPRIIKYNKKYEHTFTNMGDTKSYLQRPKIGQRP